MTQHITPCKPKRIEGAPPKVKMFTRMLVVSKKKGKRAPRKTVHPDKPVNMQPEGLADLAYFQTAVERVKERQRVRDDVIEKMLLKSPAKKRARPMDEEEELEIIEPPTKRVLIGKEGASDEEDEVEIVEHPAKRTFTVKDRAADEDDVVIVEPPARDDKEQEEQHLRNR
ncbi:hypothetical protein BDR06DRAFT_971626 [Suillus hirtellus]|nr:hypothetical protein BDR06DRAFT_971626 [Suillus hirtellus]